MFCHPFKCLGWVQTTGAKLNALIMMSQYRTPYPPIKKLKSYRNKKRHNKRGDQDVKTVIHPNDPGGLWGTL